MSAGCQRNAIAGAQTQEGAVAAPLSEPVMSANAVTRAVLGRRTAVAITSATSCRGCHFVELIREHEHLALPFSLSRPGSEATQISRSHFPCSWVGHGGSSGGGPQTSMPRC